MASTLQPVSPRANHSAHRSVDAALALAAGVQKATAHDWLYSRERGLGARVVLALRAFADCGDLEGRARFVAPLLAAVHDLPTPVPFAHQQAAAQIADLAEDCDECRYNDEIARTGRAAETTLRRLRDAKLASLAKEQECIRALDQELALLRGETP